MKKYARRRHRAHPHQPLNRKQTFEAIPANSHRLYKPIYTSVTSNNNALVYPI